MDEEKWVIQALRTAKVELESIDDKVNSWDTDKDWTNEQYDTVFQALVRSRKAGTIDPANAGHNVGGDVIHKKLAQKVKEFEDSMGTKRVLDKRSGHLSRLTRRDECLAKFAAGKKLWADLHTLKFTEAAHNTSLNGPVLTPGIIESVNGPYVKFAPQVEELEGLVENLPLDPNQLDEGHVSKLTVELEAFDKHLTKVNNAVMGEVDRRRAEDLATLQVLLDKEDKEEEMEAGEFVKGSMARKQLEQGAADFIDMSEKDLKERERLHGEAVELAKRERAEQRIVQDQMNRDLADVDGEEEWTEAQVMARLESETLDGVFGDDLEERQRKGREVMAQRAREGEEEEERERLRRKLAKQAALRAEAAAREELAARNEAELAAAHRAKMEADKAAIETQIAAFKAVEQQKFIEEQDRQANRSKLKALAEARRQAAIAQERAGLDEGSDDERDEQEARLHARKAVKAHRNRCGTVWDAVKADDVDLVRCYFMVGGTARLLSKHNLEERAQGGRTLLHTAAWWGCCRTITLLLKLGHAVDPVDTACTRTTPLQEAARSNHRAAAELLLLHGASIKHQDAQGNTCLHWTARKGYGTLTGALVAYAEGMNPGSTRGVLFLRNHRKKVPLDLAPNGTCRYLIERAIELSGGRENVHEQRMAKLRKGMVKARIVGTNVGGDALKGVQNQRRRYGRVRTQRGEGVVDISEQDNNQAEGEGAPPPAVVPAKAAMKNEVSGGGLCAVGFLPVHARVRTRARVCVCVCVCALV